MSTGKVLQVGGVSFNFTFQNSEDEMKKLIRRLLSRLVICGASHERMRIRCDRPSGHFGEHGGWDAWDGRLIGWRSKPIVKREF